MATRNTKRSALPGSCVPDAWPMCAENLATPSKLDPQDREAAAVLRLLGKLYAWKRKLAKPEPPTSSSVWRGASKEALRSLKNSGRRLPRLIAFHALPSSKVAEACQYALNQWERLKVYLQNGRIEIDQNLCKNAMRPSQLVATGSISEVRKPVQRSRRSSRSWRPANASRSTCANASTTSCPSSPPDPSTTSPLSPAELEIVRVGSPQTPDLTPPALHPHTLALPTADTGFSGLRVGPKESTLSY
jgi:hypothetical protein